MLMQQNIAIQQNQIKSDGVGGVLQLNQEELMKLYYKQAKIKEASKGQRNPSEIQYQKKNYPEQKIILIQRIYRGYRIRKPYLVVRKRNRYRKAIIDEVIKTELQYISDLKMIVQIIINPLLEKKIITEIDVTKIFSNIAQILEFNQQFCGELQGRFKIFGPYTCVGDIALKYVHFFRIYFPYVNEFTSSQNYIVTLNKSNNKFLEFIKQCERNIQFRGLKLEDLLVKPVQRLPKYVLLLQDLLKHTQKDHPDYDNINKSFYFFKQVNESNNENLTRALNGPKLFELDKFYGKPNQIQLVNGKREYRGEALRRIQWENQVKEVCVYYLTDMLLITREKLLNSESQKYILYVALELNDVSVCTDLEDTQYFRNMIMVVGANSSVTFLEDTEQSKIDHMLMLNKLIANLKNNQANREKVFKTLGNSQTLKFNVQMIRVDILGTEMRSTNLLQKQLYYIVSFSIEDISHRAYLRYKDCVDLREKASKLYPKLQLQPLNKSLFSFESTTDIKQQEANSLQIQNFLSGLFNSTEMQQDSKEILNQLDVPENFYQLPELLKQQQQSDKNQSAIRLGSRKSNGRSTIGEQLSSQSDIIGQQKQLRKQSRGFSAQKLLQQHNLRSMHSVDSNIMNNFSSLNGIKNIQNANSNQMIQINVITHHNQFDNIMINVSVRSCTLDIYKILEQQLNINSSWDFRLFEQDSDKYYHPLGDDETIAAHLQDKGILKKILTSDKKFYFKKYLFFDVKRELLEYQNDPNKMHLVYNQIVDEIKQAKYLFSFKEYVALAASYLVAQASKVTDQTITQIVPQFAYKTTTQQNWREGVTQYTWNLDQCLRIISPSANFEFVRNMVIGQVQKNPLYGAQLFPAEHIKSQAVQKGAKVLEGSTILGVMHDIFVILNPKNKEIIKKIKLQEIENSKGLAGALIIQCSNEELRFKTQYGYQIQSLIQEYKELEEQEDQYSDEQKKIVSDVLCAVESLSQIKNQNDLRQRNRR